MQLVLVILVLVFSSCVRLPAGVVPPMVLAERPARVPRHVEVARELLAAVTPERMEYRHRPSVVVFEAGRRSAGRTARGS